MIRFALFAAALCFAVVGCTTTVGPKASGVAVQLEKKRQMALHFDTRLARMERLASLAEPILTSNTALCGKRTRPHGGYGVATRKSVLAMSPNHEHRLPTQEGGIVVVRVARGSPADVAGLRPFDVVTQVNGRAVPGSSERRAARALNRDAAVGVAQTLRVRRGTGERTLSLTPVLACDAPARLVVEDSVNAYTDGSRIYVTTGMMRFAASDIELQTVIAHELAHIVEGHVDKKVGASLLGTLLDVGVLIGTGIDTGGLFAKAGGRAFSQEYEREADYVSMYMLANAGIPRADTAAFWRRMAVEHPGSIAFASTHPTTAERFLNLTATNEEIRDKRGVGALVAPTRKRDRRAAPKAPPVAPKAVASPAVRWGGDAGEMAFAERYAAQLCRDKPAGCMDEHGRLSVALADIPGRRWRRLWAADRRTLGIAAACAHRMGVRDLTAADHAPIARCVEATLDRFGPADRRR